MPYNFALIGAAGYIAPRHMRAMKDNGQKLIAALDNNDSVGIIDSYFPDSAFFTEFERFDRYCEMLKRTDNEESIQYVSICSPNYLHDAHIRWALRSGMHAICEKPLVLNPWNADALQVLESENGTKVNCILQLRLHPAFIELKKKIESLPKDKKHEVILTYITPRGKWYHYSWKGDIIKSGGVATNIGIHFFDILSWVFGKPKNNILHLSKQDKAAGLLELENADVKWFLSIDLNDLPSSKKTADVKTFRSIKVNNEEVEFSEGFTDLHTVSYKEILEGRGFGIDDTKTSIELAYNIRNLRPTGLRNEYHPYLKELDLCDE